MAEIDVVLSRKETSEMLSKKKALFFETGKKKRALLRVNVDETIHYQDIVGIGYSFEHTSCYNIMQFPEQERRRVMELLVNPDKGLGMNLWRLCIGTPDFTYEFYTYDDMPDGEKDLELTHFSIEKDREFVIPVVKLALEVNPEILFYASPWSPPGWMKGPEKKLRKGKIPVEGGKGMCSGRLLPEYYDVYAEYLVRYVEAYKAEGIPIHAITVQNEPHHNWYAMPTCYWRAEEERDFIKNHLGPKLDERGLDTRIWCWDHNFGTLTPAEYPAVVLSDPGAAKHVDGIAFHHYSGFPRFMSKLKQRFPDKHVYFTEGSLFWLWGATRLSTYLKNWARCYTGWVP
nr:hypothetical protein [Candidatus Sigynarchaeota archaeon]